MMEDWSNLLQSVAFPILMCGVMARYIKHVQDNYVNRMIDIMRESIDNNTKAINELKGALFMRRKGDINDEEVSK